MSAKEPRGRERQEMAGLSGRQRRAIEALLLAPNVTAAAARAGIGERTLRRWLNEDERFRSAYRAAGHARLNETVGRLRAAAGEAVDALRAGLTDACMSNRIRAATVLLEHAVKLEVDDLADRVAALEAAEATREKSEAQP